MLVDAGLALEDILYELLPEILVPPYKVLVIANEDGIVQLVLLLRLAIKQDDVTHVDGFFSHAPLTKEVASYCSAYLEPWP